MPRHQAVSTPALYFHCSGESFSNTSGLADLGWTVHYLEPIPQYAAACRRRHAANPNVTVHNVAAGKTDGEEVTLVPAGPFTSAVSDELQSVTDSKLSGMLTALGWMPAEGVRASDASAGAADASAAAAAAGPVSGSARRGRAGSQAGSKAVAAPEAAAASEAAPSPATEAAATGTVTQSVPSGAIRMRTKCLNTFFTEQALAPGEPPSSKAMGVALLHLLRILPATSATMSQLLSISCFPLLFTCSTGAAPTPL